jgi:hypothetical protein
MHVEDLRWIRSYPDGFEVERLGTFPRGCPVRHGNDPASAGDDEGRPDRSSGGAPLAS